MTAPDSHGQAITTKASAKTATAAASGKVEAGALIGSGDTAWEVPVPGERPSGRIAMPGSPASRE